MKKFDREIKREMKRMEKERKRCAKQYPDWKNDEYNCGPLKFIWGVLSSDDLSGYPANFYTLNDLDITYNRDTKKYLLGLETIYKFNSTEDTVNYLLRLKKEFSLFIFGNDDVGTFDRTALFNYNSGEMFIGDSILELYWKFCLFVNGFEDIV